jgi:hypothetical protein
MHCEQVEIGAPNVVTVLTFPFDCFI